MFELSTPFDCPLLNLCKTQYRNVDFGVTKLVPTTSSFLGCVIVAVILLCVVNV